MFFPPLLQGSFLKFVLFKWLKRLILTFFVMSVLSALLFSVAPIPFTPLMAMQCLGGQKLRYDWVSLDEMSPQLIKAAVTSEDQRFVEHWGFDFKEIKTVLNETGRKRGASTISQQVAKNVFLTPSRNWLRKGLEVYFTALIEVCWTKQRIMEVYLNVAEMGNGVFGAEAAAHKFFNKSAAQLTRREAVLIIACLPSPRRWSPGRPTAYIRNRSAQIMQRMAILPGPLYQTLLPKPPLK